MLDPEHKIPLVESLKWSVQWAMAVALRHPVPLAAYGLAGIMAGVAMAVSPGLGAVAFLAYTLACIPLALLTHAEVLIGPSSFDSDTVGSSSGRVLGYLLDTIVIGIAAVLCALVPIFIIGMLVSAQGGNALGGGVELILVLGLLIAVSVAVSRPALRLPSRVLGAQPISWAQAWRLGQHNTLQLVLGPFLISLPIYVIERVAGAILPASGAEILSVVLVPVQVVLTCAFLSVAYGQLRRMRPDV